MKFVSYMRGGLPHFGAVKGEGVVSLTGRLGAYDLKELLAFDLVPDACVYAAQATADHALADITYLPVIPNPAKVLCVGLNYEGHRLETNSAKTDNPQIFSRFTDTLIGHRAPILRPKVSEALDFEGELAVIIGKPGRHIDEGRALDYVAGYACFNDGSLRDFQRHTTQFIPGKNFPDTGGLGPWMVTPDEAPPADSMQLTTRLNGEVVQSDSTADLIFSVAKVIAYCSSFTQLAPGDVIATGTPSGVGYRRTPPLFMKPGDVVEVEIDGVGVLTNPIAEAP